MCRVHGDSLIYETVEKIMLGKRLELDRKPNRRLSLLKINYPLVDFQSFIFLVNVVSYAFLSDLPAVNCRLSRSV